MQKHWLVTGLTMFPANGTNITATLFHTKEGAETFAKQKAAANGNSGYTWTIAEATHATKNPIPDIKLYKL